MTYRFRRSFIARRRAEGQRREWEVAMRNRTNALLVFIVGVALPWASCSRPGDDTAEVGLLSGAVLTDCIYLDPGGPFTPIPVIDQDKELVIRDLSVVNDPCRATNTPLGPCAPGTVGVWTFRGLMSQMAGTVPLGKFVAEWLHTFEIPVTVTTFTHPPRPTFRAAFLDPWLIASGCPAGAPIVGKGACALDLNNAPFRLLAVTNRIDLSGFVGAPPGSGYDAGPGQGRFVFGFLGGGTPAGPQLRGTVIFEYEFPSSKDAFGWAKDWHQLSAM